VIDLGAPHYNAGELTSRPRSKVKGVVPGAGAGVVGEALPSECGAVGSRQGSKRSANHRHFARWFSGFGPSDHMARTSSDQLVEETNPESTAALVRSV
jgi:hypothetical protein